MVRLHHWLNGHEFEQSLGDSEGQGSQRAAVHGVTKSGNDLLTEQEQQMNTLPSNIPYSEVYFVWY